MKLIKKDKLETKDLILLNLDNLNESDKKILEKQITENCNEKDIQNNTYICEFLNGREYTLKDANEFINTKSNRYTFAIYTKNKEFVGMMGIDEIKIFNKNGNPGYWISKNQREKGYASQAFKIYLESCFKDLNLHKLNITAFDFNIGSNKIIKKFGFKLIGIKKENYFRNGKFCDENLYELLKSDYKTNI
jgi:RimJ/RimL family protein N-acetyltransferase